VSSDANHGAPAKACREPPMGAILRLHLQVNRSRRRERRRSYFGSIGSGNAYPRCREAIASFGADRSREQLYMQGEMVCQGGMASMLGMSLTDVLKEVQPRGVSSHMHYCWVYGGRTIIKNNDHTVKGRWTIAGFGSGITRCQTSKVPLSLESHSRRGIRLF
jgi:hypothetical protein